MSAGLQHLISSKVASGVLAGLVILAFAAFAIRYAGHVSTIRNVDYFQFVDMAHGLGSGKLASWVNGMHPIGYPLLIRWGLALGLNSVQIGQGLSVIGAILLLLSAYLLAYRLTDDRWLALLTEGFLATTGYFLFFGTLEGNDMLSAGLQALSLALLVGLSERKGEHFTAGLLAGLAYVVRYTAVVTSALSLLFLLIQAIAQRRRAHWTLAGLFLGGFAVGAAVQLIPSTLVTGNPFYSVQGHNVWWHIEGLTNFATQWGLAPMEISPVEVFLADPMRFIRHWWEIARSFWIDPNLLILDLPLRLLTQAGLLFTLLAGANIRALRRGLLALYVGGLLVGLAIIRYDPRFLIVILPVLTFCAVYFLWAIVPRRVIAGRLSLPVGPVVLAVLLGWSVVNPLSALRQRPSTNADIVAVSNTLRAGGMQSPDEVLSSAIPFHDVTDLARTRYAQSYWVAPTLDSLEGLHTLARENGYQFILYDAQTGLIAHPGLESLLNPYSKPSGLTPLLIPEGRTYALYRIEGTSSRPIHRLDTHLGERIVLGGYELYIIRDAPEMVVPRVGVYLYWQAAQPVSGTYKVFVHILNADGHLVGQDDSSPAVWTAPTDTWQSGEVVVDFHTIPLPDTPPGTYTLQAGMYDESTMERLPVLSSTGEPIDDKLILTEITLDPITIEGR